MNSKVIKTIGIVASIAGAGLSLVSDWVNDKKMESEVAAQVSKAVTEALKSRES